MMESIDDLLSQLKSQYDAPPPASPSPPAQPTPTPTVAPTPTPAPSTSIDSLLDRLQNGEYRDRSLATSSIPPQPSPTPLPPLPPPPPLLPLPPLPSSTNLTTDAENTLLADLKAEYTRQDREEAQARQQQEAAERRQQEHLHQLQREALRQKAQAWLKKLDRLSGEGLWFADFAKDYSSEVDAAIDYLAALKEV